MLITPRVIRNSDEARQVTEEYTRQFQSLTPLRHDADTTPPPAPPPPPPAVTEPIKPQEDTRMITERIAVATLGALVLLLGGCNFGDKDSVAQVDTRAVERWNYLIAHQAEKAYDYLSPGTRETQTRESYAAAMNNRPVKWTRGQVQSQGV